MKRLIVSCGKDISSVNIVKALESEGGWEDFGTDGGPQLKRRGEDAIMTIPDLHIRHENIDKEAERSGFRPDVVIFPSEHAAKSGLPALTVHPIGNFNGNDLGGKARELVRAAPALMTDSLRAIKKRYCSDEFNVCFEVTHHGPYLETPTYFIEIGSEETHWCRKDAAELQASVIRDVTEPNDYPVLIGVGGGHYAPRFTELVLGFKVNFGHMLPNYQWQGHGDEEVAAMIRSALERSGTKLAYLHRKSMKGPDAQRVRSLGESVGAEWVESKDLEPINGNL